MQEDAAGGTPLSSRSPTPAVVRANYGNDDNAVAAGWGRKPSHDPDYQSEEYEQLEEQEDQLMEETSEEEEEEEEEEPSSTTAAARSRPGVAIPGLMTQEQVLPEEEFGEITVKELYDLMKEGVVNLNPAYQRDSVWTASRSEVLIDSIFRNVHIPELLFNIYVPPEAENSETTVASSKHSDPDRYKVGSKGKVAEKDVKGKRLVWNCADGKQRCTSIKRFLDGDIAITTNSGLKSKVRYQQLPPATKAIFDERKLRFGFYRELSYAQECDIFKRVQLGVVLTPHEQENASTSDYKLWIDELISIYSPESTEEQFRNPQSFSPRVVKFGNRNKSLGVFFALASALVNGHARASYRTASLRRKELNSVPLPPRSARYMVLRILERLKRLTLVPQLSQDVSVYKWPSSSQTIADPRARMEFPHRVWMIPHPGRTNCRHVSPVELMFIPLIIQRHEDRRDGDLLEIIQQVREHVFAAFPKDIKDNVRVWDCMKNFLDAFQPESHLKCIYNDDGSLVGSGPRQPPILHDATPLPSTSFDPSLGPSTSSTTSSNKRSLDQAADGHSRERNGASATASLKKRRTADDEEDKRKEETRKTAALELARIEEARRREEEANKLEEERKKREEEERKRQEAEERERARKAAQEERERRLKEVKEKRQAREREIAERDRQERERLEASERARKEKSELEREAIAKAEREEIERIMNEDLEFQTLPKEDHLEKEGPVPAAASVPSSPDTPLSRSIPPIARSNPNDSQNLPSSKPKSDSRSTARRNSQDSNVAQTPPVPSTLASSSGTATSKSKSTSKSKNPTPTSTASANMKPADPPAAPPRVFSGLKARLAGQILGTARPAPAAPAPALKHRKTAPASPKQPSHQPQRQPIKLQASAQQYDSRGREIRPELVQREEEDELEAYGGRGEDDIILAHPSAFGPPVDSSFDDTDYNRRKDLEVRERLLQKKPNGSTTVDLRDREVQERLFAKLSQGGGSRGRAGESVSNRSTPSTPRDVNGNPGRLSSANGSNGKGGASANPPLERASATSSRDRDSYQRPRSRSPIRERLDRDWDRRPAVDDRRSGDRRGSTNQSTLPGSLPPRPTFRSASEYSRR